MHCMWLGSGVGSGCNICLEFLYILSCNILRQELANVAKLMVCLNGVITHFHFVSYSRLIMLV